MYHLEDVLHEYVQPYDPRRPRVCLDEGCVQFMSSKRAALEMEPGQVKKEDYEYERDGSCSLFLACEPLAGKRIIQVSPQRTKVECAQFVRRLVEEEYPQADKIVLILDNLNTHQLGALYSVYEAEVARRLCSKLELHYTPLHGSWVNMAEIELSVLGRQVLSERLANRETLEQKVAAWQARRNRERATINWRFTAQDARIKLKRLYPTLEPTGPEQEGRNDV